MLPETSSCRGGKKTKQTSATAFKHAQTFRAVWRLFAFEEEEEEEVYDPVLEAANLSNMWPGREARN